MDRHRRARGRPRGRQAIVPVHEEGRSRKRLRPRVLRGCGRRRWIGTDGGVSHWRDGVFQTFKRSTGLVYSSVRMLLIDRTGTLWVATDGGVSWIRSGKLVADPTLDRLRGLRVWALHEDAGGGMWIGTQGAGLFLLKDGAFTQFTIRAQGCEPNKIHLSAEEIARVSLAEVPSASVVSGQTSRRCEGTPLDTRPSASTAHPRGLNTNQMTGGVQSSRRHHLAGDFGCRARPRECASCQTAEQSGHLSHC